MLAGQEDKHVPLKMKLVTSRHCVQNVDDWLLHYLQLPSHPHVQLPKGYLFAGH